MHHTITYMSAKSNTHLVGLLENGSDVSNGKDEVGLQEHK